MDLIETPKEDEVDEQLGTYFECLGHNNRKAWLIEEASLRKRLAINSMSDEMLEKLKTLN